MLCCSGDAATVNFNVMRVYKYEAKEVTLDDRQVAGALLRHTHMMKTVNQ